MESDTGLAAIRIVFLPNIKSHIWSETFIKALIGDLAEFYCNLDSAGVNREAQNQEAIRIIS